MDTKVRKSKLLEFQNGQVSVLSTTDAGSRGLDTVMACDVINYDFPLITAEYIHRLVFFRDFNLVTRLSSMIEELNILARTNL